MTTVFTEIGMIVSNALGGLEVIADAEAGHEAADHGESVSHDDAGPAEVDPARPDVPAERDEDERQHEQPPGMGQEKRQPDDQPLKNRDVLLFRFRILPPVDVFFHEPDAHRGEMRDHDEKAAQQRPGVLKGLRLPGAEKEKDHDVDRLVPDEEERVIGPALVDLVDAEPVLEPVKDCRDRDGSDPVDRDGSPRGRAGRGFSGVSNRR